MSASSKVGRGGFTLGVFTVGVPGALDDFFSGRGAAVAGCSCDGGLEEV